MVDNAVELMAGYSMCCIKMLNWDLSCRVNLMLHRAHSVMKRYIHTAEQAPIQHAHSTC